MESTACDKVADDNFNRWYKRKHSHLLLAQDGGTAFNSTERQHSVNLLCMQRASPLLQ